MSDFRQPSLSDFTIVGNLAEFDQYSLALEQQRKQRFLFAPPEFGARVPFTCSKRDSSVFRYLFVVWFMLRLPLKVRGYA